VVAFAFGALVDDLGWVRACRDGMGWGGMVWDGIRAWLTIALMELPFGPVTDTQAPQFAASSHRWRERAVPKRWLGRV
jgi:hypothetical protein